MRFRFFALAIALNLLLAYGTPAQTRKPLNNDDIVNMTKQGFEPPLIVKAIETSATDFDVSAQALLNLKNSGVDSAVMAAMLSAQGSKPSARSGCASRSNFGNGCHRRSIRFNL